MIISGKDKAIIRDLAKHQLELASTDEMSNLRKEWRRHNDCISGRPMVTVEWMTFRKEIIEPRLRTKGKIARLLESFMLGQFIGSELFGDDSIVNDFVGVPVSSLFIPFGIIPRKEVAEEGLGQRYKEVLANLDNDYKKLGKSRSLNSYIASRIGAAYLNHLIGDIIPVKNVGMCLYSVPTQDIIHIMSMENMMLALYDSPEKFKEMIDRLCTDYVRHFTQMAKHKCVLPTANSEFVAQGTYAFTSDLPDAEQLKGRKITTKDVWGFMDSQETSGISPDMYEEFIFPYYKKVADMFGLLSYACCEPVDPIWDNCVSKFENLRKVSISPWCNEEFMGERLQGRKVVYQRKPSPNFLGVDVEIDKDAFAAHVRKTLNAAKGLNIEFTQRDVYTIHNNVDKVRDYVQIVRREYERY